MRDGGLGSIPPEELTQIDKIIGKDKDVSQEEMAKRATEPLEEDLQKGMDEAATVFNERKEEERMLSGSFEKAQQAHEKDAAERRAREREDLLSQVEEINKANEAEGAFDVGHDQKKEKLEATQREIWLNEDGLDSLNLQRSSIVLETRGLESQKNQLYSDLIKLNTDEERENDPRYSEYQAIFLELKSRQKELAKVDGLIAEKRSLNRQLQKEIGNADVSSISSEEEGWFENQEAARVELENRKRALQEQLIGSSAMINEMITQRDSFILQKGEAQRRDEEAKKGTWVGKLKMVFRTKREVVSLDDEIASLNAEIEASFRRAENLIEDIKQIDGLLENGEAAEVSLETAHQDDDIQIVREQKEKMQSLEELAGEMGVDITAQEAPREEIKKAA